MARIVTIGGSIGGLATALVLSARGHEVTVLERDADPLPEGPDDAWRRWARRGVPHLRGTHMFNARGVQVLRDYLPEVLTAMTRAGAREVPVPGTGFDRLSCRRTTYELALRTAALGHSAIHFKAGTTVDELLPGAPTRRAIPHVAGVRTRDGRTFPADLVVDAAGRSSRVPSWLATLGAAAPRPHAENSGMSVHTRWYRLLDPPADQEPVQADLGYGAFILAPADDGMFSVTFGTFGDDPALRSIRNADRHHAAAASIPAIAPWISPDVSTPDGGVHSLKNLPNRWRPLTTRGGPVASGIVWLGDAAVCTNPRFGRGVALALVQAVSLADALDRHEDPVDVIADLAATTDTELVPWFHDAVAGDAVRRRIAERVRAGESLASIGGPGDDPAVRLARAGPLAVERHPTVRTAFLRTWHLLDPPEAFAGDPQVRAAVDAASHDLPPPPGPSYRDMAALAAVNGATVRGQRINSGG